MNSRLKEELARVSHGEVCGIGQVLGLLGFEWDGLVSELQKPLANDAMVEFQFLKGLKDEFDDGFWDGGHDAEMHSRIRKLHERVSAASDPRGEK